MNLILLSKMHLPSREGWLDKLIFM